MVVDAFLNVVASVLSWLLGLLPHLDPPSWFSGVGSALSTVTGALSGTTAWLPWDVLLLAVAFTLLGLGVAVSVRGFRIVASFLTLGGGS